MTSDIKEGRCGIRIASIAFVIPHGSLSGSAPDTPASWEVKS